MLVSYIGLIKYQSNYPELKLDDPNSPLLKFDSEILLNARIGVRDVDSKWELTAWAKNLTNELNYTSKLALFGTIYGTYIPPRTYGVTARFRF